MKKGGYKIIDMGEKAFSPFVAQKVNGAYDAIHGNNRFSVMLSGIVYDSKLLADTIVNFTETDDVYKAIILVDGGMLCITIDEDDVVTVKPLQRTDAEAATTLAAGLIKQIEHQPNATPATEDEEKTAPTVAEYNSLVEKYNNLLGAMVEAEVMEEAQPEPPTPTLVPLAVGDSISGGAKIYVEKVDNIKSILQGILGEVGETEKLVTIAIGGSARPKLEARYSNGYYSIRYDFSAQDNKQYIVTVNPDNTVTWNDNIGEDGALTLNGSVTGTIATLSGEGWNGVVIGKMA